jgi:hypothetical protein
MAVPKSWDCFETDFCEWFIMKKDVYEHKKYPTCGKCYDLFVPIKGMDKTICFKCQFLEK